MIPKFRFYDNYFESMFRVVSMDWGRDGIPRAIYVEEMEGAPIPVLLSDGHLMQSTGLFDKNGVEIFEGDFIRCEHRRTGTVFLGEVKYDNRYGFWGVTDRRFKDLSAIPAAEVTYNGYISDSTFCEIIGNIYENPELEEIIRG